MRVGNNRCHGPGRDYRTYSGHGVLGVDRYYSKDRNFFRKLNAKNIQKKFAKMYCSITGSNPDGQCCLECGSKIFKYAEKFRNDFTIQNICTHPYNDQYCKSSTFFVSNSGVLYGTGHLFTTGLDGYKFAYTGSNYPHTIYRMKLQNVDQVSIAKEFCIALCGSKSEIVIQNWSRLHSVPTDVIRLLVSFIGSYGVY